MDGTASTTLMDLPFELRQQIWYHAIHREHFVDTASLLRLNRQTHDEVSNVLYQKYFFIHLVVQSRFFEYDEQTRLSHRPYYPPNCNKAAVERFRGYMAQLRMVDAESSTAPTTHFMLVGLDTLKTFLLEVVRKTPLPMAMWPRDHCFLLEFYHVSCMSADIIKYQKDILKLFRQLLWEAPRFQVRGAHDEVDAVNTVQAVNSVRWDSWKDFINELYTLRSIARGFFLQKDFWDAKEAFKECNTMIICVLTTRQHGWYRRAADESYEEWARWFYRLEIDKSLVYLALAEIHGDYQSQYAFKALKHVNRCLEGREHLLDENFDLLSIDRRRGPLLRDTSDLKYSVTDRTRERLDLTRELIRLAADVLLEDDTINSDLDLVEKEIVARRLKSSEQKE